MQRQHRFDRCHRPVRPFPVCLIDDENVRDLHDAGLQRLDLVAAPGHDRDDRHVRGADDVDFVLTDADRFDQHDVFAGGIEDDGDLTGGAGKTTEIAPGCHAADENVCVTGVRLHPDAVAENRTAAERARRIHRDHSDRPAALADFADHAIDQRALACAWRSGDTDQIRAPAPREDAANEIRTGGGFIFNQ